jgi:hypothetical protein
MTDEKVDKLIKRFPDIFPEIFNIECDDGWYDLIFNLCRDVQHEVNNSGCSQVEARQIKEKFASLRFYYSGGNEVVDAIVNKYEKMSHNVCEISGDKGVLTVKNGWYKTLSTKMAKELGFVTK